MNNILDKIRSKSTSNDFLYKKIIKVILIFIFGVIIGIFSKFCDLQVSNESPVLSSVLSSLGQIFTGIGVWVLISTIISIYSFTPIRASVNVFSFFIGMLISYYLYTKILFGFFPIRYFIAWSVLAVIGSIFSYILWYSKGKGLFPSFIASIPIAVLLSEGYTIIYIFSVEYVFDFCAALFLYFIIPTEKMGYLRIIPITVILFIILNSVNLGILSFLL